MRSITEIKSIHPVVIAVLSGKAPPNAVQAAARGMLPIPQADLLEVLVGLSHGENQEIATTATATLAGQDTAGFDELGASLETAPSVLTYLAARTDLPRPVLEAITINPNTPDEAITALAMTTTDGSVLEMIASFQQRLIRAPLIIDALLNNPARTPESERRARETKQEFFEKERGAQQIAGELRARGQNAAAEFVENSESLREPGGLTLDDAWLIAKHIEVEDDELDDSWLALEILEELQEETIEERAAHAARLISEAHLGKDEVTVERISLIRRIMLMNIKDRVKLAMKGDREARGILVRDSNKIVGTAVINNPRITEQEVEKIAAMRTVADEVLRLVGSNRAWARVYPIMHNLVRNPRTPLPTSINILPRILTRDLKAITQNRNISEAVRRQAQRLLSAREGR
ncbi:MAG: hypothetical protein ABIP75_07290 [Pyrinomonadaceae bacterium]